jgi:hypothetical protein
MILGAGSSEPPRLGMTNQANITFEFNRWTSQFEKVVDSDLRATSCRRSLVEADIDPRQLSFLLAHSCKFEGNPASQFFNQWRTQAKDEIRRALRLADRLDEDREALLGFRSKQSEPVLAMMEESARSLRQSAHESRDLCKKTVLNSDLVLIWLIHEVQETTGRPHYKELSILLDCAYSAYGEEMPMLSEETLRKAYQRFQRDSPLKEMLSSNGKQMILITAFIWLMATFIQSLASLQPSSPPQTPNRIALP